MWNRLLLAIDQFDSGQVALAFTCQLARDHGADVRVLHVHELPMNARVPPLESGSQARLLVDEAVFTLRLAGVGAEGRASSVRGDAVARVIAAEAAEWHCDAIVLGSRRLRGIDRLSGRGVRERVVRLSPLPVVAAPTPVINGTHSPVPGRSDALG
ncbi:MAG: universal stress protein [Acidimicrobiales bacterium]|jgi:nucleotide-binding universal stress UspA family protein